MICQRRKLSCFCIAAGLAVLACGSSENRAQAQVDSAQSADSSQTRPSGTSDTSVAPSHAAMRFADIPWASARSIVTSMLRRAGYTPDGSSPGFTGSIYGFDADIYPGFEEGKLASVLVFVRTTERSVDDLTQMIRSSVTSKYGPPAFDIADSYGYLIWFQEEAPGNVGIRLITKKDEPPYGVWLNYTSWLARPDKKLANPF